VKGLHSLSHEQVLARHASKLLRSHAHLFLGIQEVQWILERMSFDYPGLVGEVQKVLPFQRIAEVLRRLLEEHVSIRNMRAISESLIVWGPKEKDMLMLTEYVRGDLGRYLAHRATNGTGVLSAVLLDPALEKAIRECIKPTSAGNFLAMPSEQTIAIAQRISEAAGETSRPALAVVASMDIRRYVRRIIEVRLNWLPVYSYQELGEHARIEPIGRVSA
jgi:type III secretion protein V